MATFNVLTSANYAILTQPQLAAIILNLGTCLNLCCDDNIRLLSELDQLVRYSNLLSRLYFVNNPQELANQTTSHEYARKGHRNAECSGWLQLSTVSGWPLQGKEKIG